MEYPNMLTSSIVLDNANNVGYPNISTSLIPISLFQCNNIKLGLFKEYLKLLNRLYDITWFGSVYA